MSLGGDGQNETGRREQRDGRSTGGGVIAWAQMGDPNASIPTPQPVIMRPMFGAFGRAVGSTSIAFVSQLCAAQGVAKGYGLTKRIEAVKVMRLASAKAPTRELASTPSIFAEIRQPKTNYLALPRVSSERRAFIPIAYASADLIAGDKLQTIPNATLF